MKAKIKTSFKELNEMRQECKLIATKYAKKKCVCDHCIYDEISCQIIMEVLDNVAEPDMLYKVSDENLKKVLQWFEDNEFKII